MQDNHPRGLFNSKPGYGWHPTDTAISTTSGREGPEHDPYGWTELTVSRTLLNGKRYHYTLHSSALAGDRITITQGDRITLDKVYPLDSDKMGNPYHDFQMFTGFSPADWHFYHMQSVYRCRKCGSRDTQESEGFCGETVTFCAKCGNMMFDNFHVSMVE